MLCGPTAACPSPSRRTRPFLPARVQSSWFSQPETQPFGSGGAPAGGAEKYLSRTSEAGRMPLEARARPALHHVHLARRVAYRRGQEKTRIRKLPGPGTLPCFPGALNTPGVTELVSLLPRRATALAVCCRPPSVSFQEVSAATFAKLLSPRRGCQLHFSSFAPNQTKPRRDAHL